VARGAASVARVSAAEARAAATAARLTEVAMIGRQSAQALQPQVSFSMTFANRYYQDEIIK
jgi:hypothetical protein